MDHETEVFFSFENIFLEAWFNDFLLFFGFADEKQFFKNLKNNLIKHE